MFVDGTYEVGVEIEPGTYRTRDPVSSCYWARLKGFGGTLDEIIANDDVEGYGIVAIAKRDKGLESSNCGEWTKDLSAACQVGRTRPPARIGSAARAARAGLSSAAAMWAVSGALHGSGCRETSGEPYRSSGSSRCP